MIRLEAAGATDVGRRRSHNEDAFHVGDSVFVLADGMGGHKAGEVASAAAVEALTVLDGRVFGTPEEAREALEQSVQAANRRVAAMGERDADFEGMGTTLTVAMGEGRRLHVAHVGDSRAYLLRDGTLTQLTADHTLVQHLVDEGQITEAEAERHPRRSVVTRAIGISDDIEVDLLNLELAVDDVFVLCSDGLTDVVDDETIEQIVREAASLQAAVDALVDLANLRGGPDNITVVGLRAMAIGNDVAPAQMVGAAGPNDTQPHVPLDADPDDEDDEPPTLGTPTRPVPPPDAPRLDLDEPAREARPGLRVGLVVVAAAVLVAVVVGGGRLLLGRSWYVGVEDGRVVVLQGVPGSIGPIDLSWVHERSDVEVDELPAVEQAALRDGISAADLDAARAIVERVRALAQPPADDQQADDQQADDQQADDEQVAP